MKSVIKNPLGWLPAGLVLALAGAGCSSLPQGTASVNRGPSATEVSPGKAGSCSFVPCRVFFRTPPASGPLTVLANGSKVGSFAPDTLVSLGSFNTSTLRINVQGLDVPTAFVYMPTDNR